MATGHLNPGYGDVVSRLRRARSAVQCGSEKSKTFRQAFGMDMDAATLDDIRERAKDMWLQPGRSRTSYNDHYQERVMDVNDITTTRPTSATRRNKPHPSDVFLTTRLHHVPGYGRLHEIPGYHNPDTTIGKETYQVDRSVPGHEQGERSMHRSKYIGRVQSAAANQYRMAPELQAINDPIKRQATAAWLKLADPEERDHVLASLNEKLISQEQCYTENARPLHTYQKQSIASLHRYPRSAGAREAHHIASIFNRQHGFGTRNDTVANMKQKDIENFRNVRFRAGPSKRGDFCIHPEWTPQMTHHKLNGLSSVDMPYLPGR